MQMEPACLSVSTCVPYYMASQSSCENLNSTLPVLKLVEIKL